MLQRISLGLLPVVVTVLVVASSSGAGKRQSYRDGAFATVRGPDIRSVVVESQDSGAVRFDITVVDTDVRIGTGESVYVSLDVDRNASTGLSTGTDRRAYGDRGGDRRQSAGQALGEAKCILRAGA